MILSKNSIIIKNEIFSRKNGLGKIHLIQYKEFEVAARVIDFERLSRYDLEGFSNDLDEIL